MGIVFGCLHKELGAVGHIVLARGLGGERRLNAGGMCQLQGAVHLVGADVVEQLALVFLGPRFPIFLGGLQQSERAHHVGAREREGILDAAVHMALGRKMDDAVYPVVADDAAHQLQVGDVALDERIVRPVFDVLEVCQVAGVGQFVKVDDVIFGIFFDKETHYVRSDESGASGDKYITHFTSLGAAGDSPRLFVYIVYTVLQRVGPVGNAEAEGSLELGLVEDRVCRTLHG